MTRGHFPTVGRVWRFFRWVVRPRPRLHIALAVLLVIGWLMAPYAAYQFGRLGIRTYGQLSGSEYPEIPSYIFRLWSWGLGRSEAAERSNLREFEANRANWSGYFAFAMISSENHTLMRERLIPLMREALTEDYVAALSAEGRQILFHAAQQWIRRVQGMNVQIASGLAERFIAVFSKTHTIPDSVTWSALPDDAIEPTHLIRPMPYVNVEEVEFTPSGDLLVGRGYGWVVQWDVETWEPRPRIRAAGPVSMAMSPTADVIVTPVPDGFEFRQLPEGELIRMLPDTGRGVELDLEFSPDGQWAVVWETNRAGFSGPRLSVWDLEAEREIHTINEWAHRIESPVITRDGGRVVLGNRMGEIISCDVDGNSLPTVVPTAFFRVDEIQPLRGDDLFLVVQGMNVSVFDAANSVIDRTFQPGVMEVNAVAVLSDGIHVLLGGDGPKIQLWNVKTAELVATFIAEGLHVDDIAIEPSGDRFASLNQGDASVSIYDMPSLDDLTGEAPEE